MDYKNGGGVNNESNVWYNIARNYSNYWITNDLDDDMSHYKLEYNVSNTWSQKYNLIFEKILNLTLFDQSVFKLETQYYQTQMFKYGVPLDSRANFTKGDWSMWSASLGTRDQLYSFIDANYQFLIDTPDRVPWTDWYQTNNARLKGFMARPVIGGIYMPMVVDVPR